MIWEYHHFRKFRTCCNGHHWSIVNYRELIRIWWVLGSDTVDGSEIRRSPVNFVGSPINLQGLYMPGGDRRISEPSNSMEPKNWCFSVDVFPFSKWECSGSSGVFSFLIWNKTAKTCRQTLRIYWLPHLSRSLSSLQDGIIGVDLAECMPSMTSHAKRTKRRNMYIIYNMMFFIWKEYSLNYITYDNSLPTKLLSWKAKKTS